MAMVHLPENSINFIYEIERWKGANIALKSLIYNSFEMTTYYCK